MRFRLPLRPGLAAPATLAVLVLLAMPGTALRGQEPDPDAEPATTEQEEPPRRVILPPGVQPSGTAQPGTAQPGTAQPGTAQPGTAQPGTAQPGTAQPGTAQPGTAQPGTAQPGTAQPGTGFVPGAPAIPGVTGPGALVGTPPSVAAEPADIILEYPTGDIKDIAVRYQQLTGDHVIYDINATSGEVTIVSNPDRPMTRTEAIEFIKASLLLNGWAIVPVSDGVVKLLSTGAKPPTSEGVRTVLLPDDLPEGEEVVNYIMQLNYITPEDAAKTFALIVPNHPYGKVTPVTNAGAVVITDNTPVIKSLIDLQKKIDVPSAQVTDRMIRLERADSEEVAGIINEILGAQSQGRSGSGGGRTTVAAGNAAQALATAIQNNPGAPGAAALPVGTPDESSVIVQSVPRLNSILVIARPVDVTYIERLIMQLDAPAEFKNFLQRQLRFVPVVDVLDVAADALTRGVEQVTSGGGAGVAGAGAGGRRSQTTGLGQTRSALGAQGGQFGTTQTGGRLGTGGGLGGLGGLSGAGTTRAGLSSSIQSYQPPASIIVGKTLLIADPQSNSLIVSGPPEQLTLIDDLLDAVDTRPRQVYISAIIAAVSLGDEIQYGVDLLRKVDTMNIGGTPVSTAGIYNTIANGTGIIDPFLLEQVSDFTDAGLLGASGLNTYFAIGEFMNAYVKALENTNRFKVLGRPSVYTANNSPALIEQGEEVPVPSNSFVSGGVNGTTQSTNIDYRRIVLSLEVLPLINSSDEVTLQVSQQNNNITGSTIIDNNEIPIVATQTLQTFVNVPNGSVVAIGGLIVEQEQESNAGLPILAKIPIIRNLTGYTDRETRRQELMIFIQPTIVESTGDLVKANLDEIRRTVVGPSVYEFAKPPIDDSNVLFPIDDPETGTEQWVPARDLRKQGTLDSTGSRSRNDLPGLGRRRGPRR